ncbi:YceI family protein [Actinoplanes sp. KI2]|uniref:YceI family protein n=1 Tax=Actinoplanes sp. KI2 TaxID=2983315 RepID=UPI0021D57639|nr:YceI family protein [Actinoplanes sp. KI2]MCU7725075.1 YceI family protein [Actinoplanes sp. KI2]
MTTNLSTDLRPGTYLIDQDQSVCTLHAAHAFGLKPVTATMAIRAGTVTIGADPAQSSASAQLDAATFRSDDPRRDKDIRGKRFLAAADHPVIAFRSTGCTRSAAGWRMTGMLSVRGTDSEVTLTLYAVEPTTTGYRCTASCTLDRVTAGVKAGRGIIARPVRLELEVYFRS